VVAVEAFLAGLEPEVREQWAREGDGVRLGAVLDEMVRSVGAAWPELTIDAHAFVGDLGRHLDGDAALLDQLAALQAADLYLAWACGRGDAHALARFESAYGGDIDRAVARVGATSHGRDDLAQRVREKLFVSEGDRPPRITAYAGRGSLRSWVRVTAVRTVLDVVRWKDDAKRQVSVEAGVLEATPGAEPDPELDYLRRAHGERLPNAMRRAFASLTARQRNLLRHRFLHGLSTERIAKIYAVHRATAFRWLEAARQQLFDRTRQELVRELQLEGRDLESLIAALRSRLDLSVGQLLGSDLEAE
jgi:RNA polymerase sigma-70 factor (ECF subfamily)